MGHAVRDVGGESVGELLGEFGSTVAMQNSHAVTDDELHPLRTVPRWSWPGDDQDGTAPVRETVAGRDDMGLLEQLRD